jgi:hypothetical protein
MCSLMEQTRLKLLMGLEIFSPKHQLHENPYRKPLFVKHPQSQSQRIPVFPV